MRIFIIAAAFSMILYSTTAFSSDEINKCASSVDHATMRKCLEDSAKRANDELMSIEKKLIVSLKGWDQDEIWQDKAIRRLNAAANAFRAYQKQQCEFEASVAAGGNAAGDLRAECIYRLAKDRSKLLLEQEKNLKD